jgi:hypothetical protein
VLAWDARHTRSAWFTLLDKTIFYRPNRINLGTAKKDIAHSFPFFYSLSLIERQALAAFDLFYIRQMQLRKSTFPLKYVKKEVEAV